MGENVDVRGGAHAVEPGEPGMDLVECFGSGCQCILDPGCRLKVALSDALAAFLKVLDQRTLADLLGKNEHAILKFLPPAA